VHLFVFSFSEFCGAFVTFNEEFLPALAIDSNELRVKVSRVNSKRIVSPRSSIGVIERQLHGLGVLFHVHFKLFREGSLDSYLHLFNLITIEAFVIEHLPLFNSAFVELDLAFTDLSFALNLFNPHFHFSEHLSGAGIVQETINATIAPLHIDDIVLMVVVAKIVGVITVIKFLLLLGVREAISELSKALGVIRALTIKSFFIN